MIRYKGVTKGKALRTPRHRVNAPPPVASAKFDVGPGGSQVELTANATCEILNLTYITIRLCPSLDS